MDAGDRTRLVPKHQGHNILPNLPLFSRLLRSAHHGESIAIRDKASGFIASYVQLLTDVLHLRNALRDSLDEQTLAQLRDGADVFINLLGPGGYEHTVAFFAVMAVGAVVVPLSPGLAVGEMAFFVRKSHAVSVLTVSTSATLGKRLEEHIAESSKSSFRSIGIRQFVYRPPLLPTEIIISSDLQLDGNGSALVIFTSGTTGPPKGVVKRRAAVHDAALAVAHHYELGADDVVLHALPVHHASGIGLTLLPFLLSGSCVEFQPGGFDAGSLWERWQQGGLTFFSGVPTIYMKMMQYYEDHLKELPPHQRDSYITGAKQFRGLLCGTAALPRPLQQKWTDMRDGRKILTRYGGTETGAIFKVPLHAVDVPENSVGVIVPGIDMKLSDGDEGEVLVKSANMFSKYLFDPEATAKAHDSEGYFKTGDIARRSGRYYFILGRASEDTITSGSHKISALHVEREILGLDYISEAAVVGVADEKLGQSIAGVVTLRGENTPSLTLERLREDLRGTLPDYKIPTILRVIEELPTGKVLKKNLIEQHFPPQGHSDIQRL